PSRTTNLRNEISNFQQRFDESFHEAWDHYKDLRRACPHHGFTELHILDTFYNALNPADKDSLNSAAGGNLLERRTQDVLTIIENKSKVRNSQNKSIVSQVKSSDVNSSSSSEIAKLTHAVNQQTSAVTTAMATILKQFQATSPPTSVKAVEEICVICDVAVNYNQGNFDYRPPSVANQIRPPGNIVTTSRVTPSLREICGNILIHGTCLKCNSGAGNSFTYNPNPESSMKFKAFLIYLYNPISIYTCVRYVKAILTMVMNVRNESRLSMSRNRATIKTLVIMLIHMTHQVNDAHYGYNCLAQVPFIQTLPSFSQQYPCCEDCGGPHKTYQYQPMNYYESNPCYDSNYFGFDQTEPPKYLVNSSLNIQNEPDAHDLFISKLIQQKLQNEYAQPFLAIAITLDLPTVKPEDSLRMGDEHLDTIPETESDEFIKSSIENLIPSPNEFEYLSNSECDIDSLLDEFAGELIHLKTIPLGIDETDCDPEEEIRLIEKLLYDNSSPHPPKKFNSKNSDAAIESFSPSPIPVEDNDSFIEEIDLSFTLDDSMPSGTEEDDYNSERNILIPEELLSNDSLLLSENESFHFDIPSSPRLPAKPPDDDS
nr:reverse transcriptase domain-containing protein [Tanacetum cinerariifolium]